MDDRDPEYPKTYLKRVLSEIHRGNSADDYAFVADQSDIDVLANVCQISFAPFKSDVEKWLTDEI